MEENICSICYESLDNNKDTYKLECNHNYHAECIIKWFRTKKSNCPMCNDNGINEEELGYWKKIATISEIKKFARRKICPQNIKDTLNKIKKYKEKEKTINKESQSLRNEYKDVIKKCRNLRKSIWNIRSKIRKLESSLLAQMVIKPIYIK